MSPTDVPTVLRGDVRPPALHVPAVRAEIGSRLRNLVVADDDALAAAQFEPGDAAL